MADEFVDFYEILTLPLESDSAAIRKRLNELYVEAQRNLDHRNFATRVKYQELFEVTLPQARYILLDEGRRDDYDLMVRDARAPAGTPPTSRPASKPAAPSTVGELGQEKPGFKLSQEQVAQAPKIEELPPDPAAVAREREETWKKWKAGLQSAMEREVASEKEEIRAKVQPAPHPAPGAQPQTVIAPATTAPTATEPTAGAPPPRRPGERPRVKFDFGGSGAAEGDARRGEGVPAPGAEEFAEEAKARLAPEEIERRRTEHRRELMKSELTDTGAKAAVIGAGAVLVPGVIAMVIFMSRFYPSGQTPRLALASGLAWLLWLVFLGVATFVSANLLSKSMRRKRSLEMTLMSYEELLRHLHKG